MTIDSTPRYTLREAAKLAKISPAKLGKRIKDGKVPGCFHDGGRYYIFRSHFDRYIGLTGPLDIQWALPRKSA